MTKSPKYVEEGVLKMKKYSRKLIVATLLTSIVISGIVSVSANTHTFKDVPNSNSHFDSISNLVDRGIIKGYSDGAFRSEHTLTHGQLAKILVRAFALEEAQDRQLPFIDIASNTAVI